MCMYFLNMTLIGEKIKRLRKKAKLTQPELAEKLGVTPKVISDYETDKANPPTDRLPVIANYFNISVDELIGTKQIDYEAIPENGNGHRHGNSRSVKLLELFDQLSPEEQRTILKQIRGLIAQKENSKG